MDYPCARPWNRLRKGHCIFSTPCTSVSTRRSGASRSKAPLHRAWRSSLSTRNSSAPSSGRKERSYRRSSARPARRSISKKSAISARSASSVLRKKDGLQKAVAWIKGIVAQPEVGSVYEASRSNRYDDPYGAFVEFLRPAKTGFAAYQRSLAQAFGDHGRGVVERRGFGEGQAGSGSIRRPASSSSAARC